MRLQLSPLFRGFLIVVPCVVNPVIARADDAAAAWTKIVDEKEKFWATGTFSTTDTGVAGIGGKFVNVPGGAGDHNWRFSIVHTVLDWAINPPRAGTPGAEDCTIGIGGKHRHGPHDDDLVPNNLPHVNSKSADIKFGETRVLGVSNTHEHPTSGEDPHFDHYAIRSWVTALKDEDGVAPDTEHSVGGMTQIRAHHTGKAKDVEPKWETIGCSWNGGSTLHYDAATQRISFNLGPIDICNREGITTPFIDPIYAHDPLLQHQLIATEMVMLQLNGDGQYEFGGGGFRFAGSDDARSFEGTIDRMHIDGRERHALFFEDGTPCRATMTDHGSVDEGGSLALHNFWDINVMGAFLDVDNDWLGDPLWWITANGPTMMIQTPQSLVDATGGFTRDATVPVTVVLTLAALEGDLLSPRSLSVSRGTLLEGNRRSLQRVDDDSVEILSIPQGDKHVAEMKLNFDWTGPGDDGPLEEVTLNFCASASQPGVKAKIAMWNFDEGAWQPVATVAVPVSEGDPVEFLEFPPTVEWPLLMSDTGQVRVRLTFQTVVLQDEEGFRALTNAAVLHVK